MIKLWAYKVEHDLCTIDEVPDKYRDAVIAELGIAQ